MKFSLQVQVKSETSKFSGLINECGNYSNGATYLIWLRCSGSDQAIGFSSKKHFCRTSVCLKAKRVISEKPHFLKNHKSRTIQLITMRSSLVCAVTIWQWRWYFSDLLLVCVWLGSLCEKSPQKNLKNPEKFFSKISVNSGISATDLKQILIGSYISPLSGLMIATATLFILVTSDLKYQNTTKTTIGGAASVLSKKHWCQIF